MRRVKVKDSQDEITHKHEGKADIYLVKFSASGHLFLHIVFPWNQLDIGKCISYLRTHLGRLHYEDKGCLNMDSAGIKLSLVGFFFKEKLSITIPRRIENESIVLCSIQISAPL